MMIRCDDRPPLLEDEPFAQTLSGTSSIKNNITPPNVENRNFTSVFGDRSSFRARIGCDRRRKFAILLQFLTIEPHFVRKGCISWRLVGTAPRLKREIEKKEREEGKRARGQEGKRARGQEGKREKM